MEFLCGAVATVIIIAVGGIIKKKIVDPITKNTQDIEDLTVLISDISGKDE